MTNLTGKLYLQAFPSAHETFTLHKEYIQTRNSANSELSGATSVDKVLRGQVSQSGLPVPKVSHTSCPPLRLRDP